MYILTCIGVDNILHRCKPGDEVCLCGEKIKKKLNNVTPKIIDKYGGWCGTCDYAADDEEDVYETAD